MNLVQAVVLGIIEGLTEYLPISSTFHLIWTAKILGLEQNEFQKAFEVIIQAGAIFAVVFLYWRLWRDKKDLFPKIIVSFIPTALVGFTLYKVIKGFFFENIPLQLILFGLTGIVFIIFEKLSKNPKSRPVRALSFKEAFVVGLIQALAVIPGVSRAGAVILGLMFFKIKRDEAAEYSFFLAVPTLLAASSLDLVKSAPYLLANRSEFGVLIVGFLAAFVSAAIAVKWFISFLQKHSLTTFGVYRLVVVGLLIILVSGKL